MYGAGEVSITSEKPKRGRHRSGEREHPLSEQDIVSGALALVRAGGVDALSMRGLAQKLGVSPMAIYYYLPNKEELLRRVADSLLAAVPTPEPSRDEWQQQLREHAIALWELLSSCPGLSRVVLERPPMKASLRLGLYVFALLQAAGFDQRNAALCLMSYQMYMAGVLSAQVQMRRMGHVKRSASRRRRLPEEGRQLMAELEQVGAREWMEFGLDTMLAGIRAQQVALQARPPRALRTAARNGRGPGTTARR